MLGEETIEVIEDEEMLTRRDFFVSIQKHGRQLAGSLAPASWKLNKQVWNLKNYYPNVQFFLVKINQNKCTLCQACSSLCPQGVFQLKEFEFQIENDQCVNCKACMDVCPDYAIEIVPEIKAEKNDTHLSFNPLICRTCGQSFINFFNGKETCNICDNRDEEWLSPYM